MPWSPARPRDCNSAGEAEPKASAQGSKAEAETPQGIPRLLCCCISIAGSFIQGHLCPGELCAVCHQQPVPGCVWASPGDLAAPPLLFCSGGCGFAARSARGGSFPHGWDRRCFLMALAGSCTPGQPPPLPAAGSQPGRAQEGKDWGLCIRFLFPSLLWRDQRSDRKAAVPPESPFDFQLETFC